MAPAAAPDNEFDLESFLPFILNQTAEMTGKAFQPTYRDSHGLSRTQWRVMAIAARYDGLSARDICAIAHEEKSRVSRAIAALEDSGLLSRAASPNDKRTERLTLTPEGQTVYKQLGRQAQAFDAYLRQALGAEGEAQLLTLLTKLRAAIEIA